MTPFAALAALAGLSLRESSDFLNVPLDTIKGWSNGRRTCPGGVIAEMKELIGKQARQAEMVLQHMPGGIDIVELGYPTDDVEARSMGWPCVGAWRAIAARVIVVSVIPVTLVPSGSTPATALAVDRHTGDA